jgi:hypothetical protein
MRSASPFAFLVPLVPRVFFFFFLILAPTRLATNGALLSFPSFRIIPRAARVETPAVSSRKAFEAGPKSFEEVAAPLVRLREG